MPKAIAQDAGPGARGAHWNWAMESIGLMQKSLIIESNGSGKEKLDRLLDEGWVVLTITANHGKSYNDFLIILEK